MRTGDVTARGIILSAAPQGEYGRRLSILTDRFGKITVFAQAAAKPGSRLVGLTLPMTCAEFTLSRGKNAWNLHGARLIAALSTALSRDFERSCLGMYFLELLSLFSQEGMEEGEARRLLNLCYLALSALSGGLYEADLGKETGDGLVRALYELRLLVIEGEYTEQPLHPASRGTEALWRHGARARLSDLFAGDLSKRLFQNIQKQESKGECNSPESFRETAAAFIREVRSLMKQLVPYKFKSLEVLREEG